MLDFEPDAIINSLNSIEGQRIYIIGDVCIDEYIVGEVKAITKEAPVPALFEDRRMCNVGQASNVAVNASALKGEVCLYTSLGDDKYGDILREILKDNNVELKSVKSEYTTHRQKLVHFDDHKGYTHLYHIYKESFVNNELSKKIWKELLSDVSEGDLVIVSDYQLGVFNKEDFQNLTRKCTTVINTRRSLIDFKSADVVVCNVREVREAFPLHKEISLKEAVTILKDQLKLEKILVTKGAKGMTFYDEQEFTLLPFTNNIVDVTGAGDSVIATVGLGLAGGLTPGDMLNLANIVAGIIVNKEGTGICSSEEVRDAIS